MKLMVLDGNSIINRSFYGIRPLTTRDGLYTHAVYGFLTTLQRLLDEEKPEGLCVTFDRREPTFRHEADADYKATRHAMPEELAVQMPVLKQVLDAMDIPRYELVGFEADDLIGTISRRCEAAGWDCIIVTGDKDSLQLVTEHTKVKLVSTRMGQTTTKDMTPGTFREQYGFDPIHMIDLKALMGDTSDNIPGVPGVGEKTAMALVQRYGSIDEIYRLLPDIEAKPAAIRKLQAGEDAARHSYWLATIVTDAPLAFDPAENVRRPFRPELYDLLLKLEFQKLIDRYGLRPAAQTEEKPDCTATAEELLTAAQAEEFLALWRAADCVAVYALPDLSALAVECEAADGSRAAELYADRYEGDWQALLTALFSGDIKKAAHNVKDLMAALLAQGLPIEGFVFDTALAAYLLDATAGSYDLQRLFVAYYNEELPRPVHLEPDAFSMLGDRAAAAAALLSYTAAVAALRETLEPKLRELELEPLYYDVELPLCAVLARMEQRGFLIDRAALAQFGETLQTSITQLEQQIYAAAGAPFNINSPKQLGKVLFEDMHLPHGKKTKTGWSTNADVLDKLRGVPIVADVLQYRQYAKLKSTYADGLLKAVSPDGRIRTSFQMTVTATGRLSSTEPNLQNIPTRTELGSQMRRMFVAGECPRRRRLFADRAAPARAHLGRRGHVPGVPLGRGFPHADSGARIPRRAAGRDAGDAPPRQGRELWRRLRHLPLLPLTGHRRNGGRGEGVYGAVFPDVHRRACLYGPHRRTGARRRLRRDAHAPAPRPSGAEEQQPQPPRLRRARGAEHAHSGHGGGSDEARNGARRAAARGRGARRAAHHAGARRADRRVPRG